MAKPLIYAVVGPSGCGKTTATKIMAEFGIPSLVSYTTRDMRHDEVNGREHWFVSNHEIPPKDSMLAYTFFGGKHYWTTIDQIPKNGGCSYIIDEIALVEMIDKFDDRIDFVKILIKKNIDDIKKIVDQNRISRDDERLVLDDSYYDVVITNDGTIDDLRNQIYEKLIKKP